MQDEGRPGAGGGGTLTLAGRTPSASASAPAPAATSARLSESWTWGRPPGDAELGRYVQLLIAEQRRLCGEAADSTLFSARLRRRLAVIERQVVAAKRDNGRKRRRRRTTGKEAKTLEADTGAANREEDVAPVAPAKARRRRSTRRPFTPGERAGHGLAKLGSNAALSFAFAFLRRAWRSSEVLFFLTRHHHFNLKNDVNLSQFL